MTSSSSVTTPFHEAILTEARFGLGKSPKSLSPWLFYDEAGSSLFEKITELPEYYITRTERAILKENSGEIIQRAAHDQRVLTIVELGAGTANKTGILLEAAVRHQNNIVYRPVDVSESALIEASKAARKNIPGVDVHYQVADYTREPLSLDRLAETRILALYIGSSIGNFTPPQAETVLANLRAQLLPGDMILLGTDLRPGPHKSVGDIVRAYDDAEGVTSMFNLNVLARLNRELGANFSVGRFRHRVRWNEPECRIEMHLESTQSQVVMIPGSSPIHFDEGEVIHTENSYKFSVQSISELLDSAALVPAHVWSDPKSLFAVTLAVAR
jgi:dimethylhistidine N-methyltransferase